MCSWRAAALQIRGRYITEMITNPEENPSAPFQHGENRLFLLGLFSRILPTFIYRII